MRKVCNWNYKWAFTKEGGEVTGTVPKAIGKTWNWVNLPHTWNNIDGQDGGNDYYRGTCYYAKEFSKMDLPEAAQYYIEFEGANSSADVYLNGKKLASHDGGYSTWRVNITKELSEQNFLVVAVDNSANDRVYPQNADFTFYGGLYRSVNLIAVDDTHFDLDYFGGPGIAVTPTINGDDADINVVVWLTNAKAGQEIIVEIKGANGGVVASCRESVDSFLEDIKLKNTKVIGIKETENKGTDNKGIVNTENKGTDIKGKESSQAEIREADIKGTDDSENNFTETYIKMQFKLRIENVHLWHGRKDPYLYSAEVKIIEGNKLIDAVSARFGCRTFEIDADRGFILNGESYPLRGVSRHQDRWGIGNALLPEHHKEDMDLICEMGANTIRLAHYQHDQYFYDLCDEKGMVVWAEIPYISTHMPTGRENTILQMRELITQNYNHPSIVVWGLSNEITMTGKSNDDLIENHNILNDMVHEMDRTRLTTIAVVSMCDIHDPYIQIPDVVSFNHYFGWYGGDTSMNGTWFDNFHKEYPQIAVGVSEYGCEALNWHTSNPKQGDYTEEYQAYYHEELIKQLYTRPYIWATHVWNMFDFGADAREEGGENGQNHKGLVTFDRKYKKDSFYAYKAWLSDEPFVHICGKRYVDRVEDETRITVYSNLPEVELYVNDKSIGKQTSDEHFFYFMVPNKGESKLVAIARDSKDMGAYEQSKSVEGVRDLKTVNNDEHLKHVEVTKGSKIIEVSDRSKFIEVSGEYRDESLIRKVNTPNENYILKEKGAVLNWFDITEVEGYYSLNDTIDDIMKSDEGAQLFTEIMSNIGKGSKEGMMSMLNFDNPDAMQGLMKMMGGFTVLRLMKLMGAANVSFTKEQMLGLNAQLNKIKRNGENYER